MIIYLMKVRLAKYCVQDGAVIVSSANQLEEKYGSILPGLAASYHLAFRLGPVARVLRASFRCSDSVIRMTKTRFVLESDS